MTKQHFKALQDLLLHRLVMHDIQDANGLLFLLCLREELHRKQLHKKGLAGAAGPDYAQWMPLQCPRAEYSSLGVCEWPTFRCPLLVRQAVNFVMLRWPHHI